MNTKPLLHEFESLFQAVSPDAAAAYALNAARLSRVVCAALRARNDLPELLGANSVELMQARLDHHARFMTAVLELRLAKEFLDAVCWMDRSYADRGFDPEYFGIELAAWIEAVTSLLRPEHASEIEPIYEELLEHRQWLLDGTSTIVPLGPLDERLVEPMARYLHALIKPSSIEALSLSYEFIKKPQDLSRWWDEVIRPAMYEVGNLWAEGQISVGQEHVASAITQRVMSVHAPMILNVPKSKPMILVAATRGELHEIGARMLADLLEVDEWEVVYCGANTPHDSVVNLVGQFQPWVVCLSTTLLSNLSGVAGLIQRIRDQGPPGVKILVGGRAFMGSPETWRRVGADGYADSATSALALLNSWTRPTEPVAAVPYAEKV